MSRRTLILIVLATLALGIYLLKSPPAREAGELAPVAPKPASARQTLPETPDGGAVTRLPVPEEITALYSEQTSPEDDLAAVESLIDEFRRHNGENPVGDNVEITAALLGTNPKRLAYLPDQGPFLNSNRELLDRWGTPLFFHAISGDRLEIRSAGADRTLNTADDIIR